MSLPPPLFPEIGVVALVPDRWGPQWQARQHVLIRLARYFQVVWMDYPVGWRKNFFELQKRRGVRPDVAGLPPGFQVYRPEQWYPRVGRPPWVARWVSKQRLDRASKRLHARGCSRIVLYLWRPEFASALKQIRHDLSIYHVDDEYTFSSIEADLSPTERYLLESVGQVFIHSRVMMEKRGSFNPHTEFAPNGVDYERYATPAPEPKDLVGIPRPRIGYVGHLKRMLNWPLLLELSAKHSEWRFVFVGPVDPHQEIKIAIGEMATRPNVHFLGVLPTDRLGAYPQHLDVCMMPYRLDDYTRYIYPLKMHEYLASGRPVVSTPIPAVREFADVITIAGSSEAWSVALASSLSDEQNSPIRRADRQATARKYDWDRLVNHIACVIGDRLRLDVPRASSADDSPRLSVPLR